jgi:hypothetical protein
MLNLKDIETLLNSLCDSSLNRPKLVKIIKLHVSFSLLLLYNLKDLKAITCGNKLTLNPTIIEVEKVLEQVID